MKLTPLTPLKIIVALNILVHLCAAFIISGAPGMSGSGYGTAWGWGVLVSGFLLIAGNIILAAVTGIAAAIIPGPARESVGKAALGFILSAGVVLLMSVPMCMISFVK